MTIKDIDVTSDYFQSGGQVRTSDGMLVTFKHVCFEEIEPRINLDGIEVGDRFRLRNGETVICKRLDEVGSPIFVQREEYTGRLFYGFDGSCTGRENAFDAVEFLRRKKPSLVERIAAQLDRLDRSLVSRYSFSTSDWDEIYGPTGGTLRICDVMGSHSAKLPSGTFTISFKDVHNLF